MTSEGNLLGDGGGRSIGLVVGAPVILVDGQLAAGGSTPGSTAGGGGGTLGVSEVETSKCVHWSAGDRFVLCFGFETHVLDRTMTRASSSPR